ncbi:MAG: hypothetical protein A3J63_02340 [Candidatus Moranbacteria bacterium RIFCSPHIGHO2_02_FULL_40_12b]|nr:MAG: hypothetical protein A3J63_02340 [Candidatus Moranbacteria bacterium RIFCSPHIGHO2_02_FULL_40_12b]
MLSKDEVKHIAALARVGISDKETEKYQKDISAVLDYFEKLKEVGTEAVKPIGHITGRENSTREDKAEDFENKKDVVKLFPESKDNYCKVKSVL